MKYKYTQVRKYEGDDAYSWAVFVNNKPVVTGLSKGSIRYYRNMIELIEYNKHQKVSS